MPDADAATATRLLYYKFFLRKSSLRDKPKGVFVHTEAKRLAKDAYVAVYEALARFVPSNFHLPPSHHYH